MKIVQIVGLADGRPTKDDGRYVLECDVDARDGRGELTTVEDPAQAKLFDNAPDALQYWRRQSTVMPLRLDGKPNRPLTSYTVEVIEYPPLETVPGDF